MVNYRYLGRSGLKITEITYGNWLTHGSQVENDTAKACVRAALDAGITTSTPRTSTPTPRPRPCWARPSRASGASRSRSSRRCTGPPAPAAPTTRACPASTSWSRSTARCERLQTDYVDLYQAHRYDDATPLEETMQAFADVVRARARPSTSASPSGPPTRSAPGHALASELGFQLISNQPQYSMLWRVIEARGRPDLGRARPLADRLVARRPGRADRQVPAGRSRRPRARAATDEKGGAQMIGRFLEQDETLQPRAGPPARSPTSSA